MSTAQKRKRYPVSHLLGNKEIEKLARLARRQGWVVAKTRGGHVRFVSPGGEVVVAPTSGCSSSLLQTRKRLTAAGLRGLEKHGSRR